MSTPLARGAYLLEATITLTWAGPVHVGTGERLSATTDAPVLRDGDGRPYLPGASIRGVLRDWCEREAPLLGVSREAFVRLFGPSSAEIGQHKDDRTSAAFDRQGRLRVTDAHLENAKAGAATSEVRDHVRLDPALGAAAQGGKFDQEVALADTARFTLQYEGDGPRDPELALLKDVVEALQAGVLAFGGKTGWGLGMVACADVAWHEEARDVVGGLRAYLERRLTHVDHRSNVSSAPVQPSTGMASGMAPTRPPFSWLRFDLALQFDGPMLVAGPYRGEAEHDELRRQVDASYQTTPDGKPFLAGSSLRGALRHHALRIANSLGVAEPDGVLDTLFGRVDRDGGRRGLVRVGEGIVAEPYHTLRLDHVAIDRITGFAADSKLFNTGALASPCFRHALVVRWDDDDKKQRAAVALLLFVLRDLQQGLLWIGSRTTRGYGHVSGATLEKAKGAVVTTPKALGAAGSARCPLPEVVDVNDVAGLARAPAYGALFDALVGSWRDLAGLPKPAVAGGAE